VFGLFVLVLPFLLATRLLFLPFDLFLVPPKSFYFAVNQWWLPRVEIETPLAWVPTTLRSTMVQWLFYFGLFILPYLAWQTWGAERRSRPVALDKKIALLSVALAASLLSYVHGQRGLVGWMAFALIALAPHVFHRRRHERLGFVAILVWSAVLVSFICEWLYYDDAFGGPDERINTIFKVYYCLWPVAALGAVAACSALWGEKRAAHRRLRRAAAASLIASLAAISVLYPLFAWTTRIAGYRESELGLGATPTLDGLKYLETLPGLSDDYRAGLALRQNASPYAVVAEASDWGYSAAGRFAAIGGVTSLLGWSQHESVWRPERDARWIIRRRQALDELFTTTSLETTLRILANNSVDYVVVGSLERQLYPPEGLAKFDFIGRTLFQSGGTTVYGVSEISRLAREEAVAPGGSP
jgi:uncharacterized membrane protein